MALLRDSRVRAAGPAATPTGIVTKARGQDGLARLAASASKPVKKLFDSTEETGGFRLSVLRRELFELRQQLALTFGQVLRRFHRYLNVHVAGLFRPQDRHSLPSQAGAAAGLCAMVHLDLDFAAIDCRHLEFAAQGRAGHGDWHPAVQVRPVALKEFVRRHFEKNIKVASLPPPQTAFPPPAPPYAGAILYATGDIDR